MVISVITREDVAKKAGVSVTAVSRVMNNSGYVKKEKREAILKAVEEVGYRRNRAKVSKVKQILFYHKDLSNAYTTEMYRGMIACASQHDHMVVLSAIWNIEEIMAMQIEGVILPNETALEEYIHFTENKPFSPTVCASYGTSIKYPRHIPLVESDTYVAMELSIEYLLSKGHTKIGLATPYPAGNKNPRSAAYRHKMLPLLGEDINQYMFVADDTSDSSRSALFDAEEDYFQYGELIAKQICTRKIDITAACCFNDNVAVGMFHHFNRIGVKVPEDISIVGIDGLSIGKYVYPGLTSVSISPFEQGYECVRVLLDMIADKKVKGRTKVPVHIIERESVKVIE